MQNLQMDEYEMKMIRSQRLAGTLMIKGFVLVGMERDKTSNSGRNVFFFNESPELEAAINEYAAGRR